MKKSKTSLTFVSSILSAFALSSCDIDMAIERGSQESTAMVHRANSPLSLTARMKPDAATLSLAAGTTITKMALNCDDQEPLVEESSSMVIYATDQNCSLDLLEFSVGEQAFVKTGSTSFLEGVEFSSGNETITVRGSNQLPQPMTENMNITFTYDQILSEVSQVVDSSSKSMISLGLDGELAPPYSLVSSEIIALNSINLGLKLHVQCDDRALDAEGLCSGISASDLRLSLVPYDGSSEISRTYLETAISSSSAPTATNNMDFEVIYSATEFGFTNEQLKNQDFVLVMANGDQGSSFRYSVVKGLGVSVPSPETTITVDGQKWTLQTSEDGQAEIKASGSGLSTSITNAGSELRHVRVVGTNLTLEQGMSYDLSFKMRSTADRQITIILKDSSNNPVAGSRQTIALTSVLQDFNFSFTNDLATAKDYTLHLLMGRDSTNNVFFNNFILQAQTSPGEGQAKVWLYPLHDNPDVMVSPYYTYQVETADGYRPSYANYSVARGRYDKDTNPDGIFVPRCIRDGEPAIGDPGVSAKTKRAATDIGRNFSFTTFSFDGGPVTVKVKPKNVVVQDLGGEITNCQVLPTRFKIPCQVNQNGEMVVKLDKPRKLTIIPNYNEAIEYFTQEKIKGTPYEKLNHIPSGYKFPAQIFARGKEEYKYGHELPDINSSDTLVIEPGERYKNAELKKYKTLYFKPGLHNWRDQNGPSGSCDWTDDQFRTPLEPGQVVYLAGGAYLKGSFLGDEKTSALIGRGVIEPVKHNDKFHLVQGIDVTMRLDHLLDGIYGSVTDVTATGGWTGGTGGLSCAKECVIEDMFIHSEDDGTHIMPGGTFRDSIIWEDRAYAIMLQISKNTEFHNITVENIDVIYHESQHDAVANLHKATGDMKNIVFRNIFIDAPAIRAPIEFSSPDASKRDLKDWFTWTGGGTPENHGVYREIVFENIRVNSPYIDRKSDLYSDFNGAIDGALMKDIYVQGVKVTESNKTKYFDFKGTLNKIKNLIFE